MIDQIAHERARVMAKIEQLVLERAQQLEKPDTLTGTEMRVCQQTKIGQPLPVGTRLCTLLQLGLLRQTFPALREVKPTRGWSITETQQKVKILKHMSFFYSMDESFRRFHYHCGDAFVKLLEEVLSQVKRLILPKDA